MVENLCTHFSPPLKLIRDNDSLELEEPHIKSFHPFPPPSALARPSVSSTLRTLGFGYRAEFIQKTSAMLLDTHVTDVGVFAFLRKLRSAPTQDAREELVRLMGVGRKVADCVLLMSLDKVLFPPAISFLKLIVSN
jgi:N-glycosylase/DNA lyase